MSKEISIQKEIDRILQHEFQTMLDNLEGNTLFELIRSKKYRKMDLQQIKSEVVGKAK